MAKKSFKPDYNACIGNNKHENFGSIYESMVKSEQFKALSSPATQNGIKRNHRQVRHVLEFKHDRSYKILQRGYR